MQIIHANYELIDILKPLTNIAFVPTMGNLHEGHLKLIQEAFKKTKYVVVSIFINPLQFNSNEDFKKYPRTLEKSGVDMLVLSSVPEDIAKEITETVSVPTIGFHSGQLCNGEVFILYDLLINSDAPNDLYVSNVNSPHKTGIIKDFLLQFIKNHS